MFWKIIDSQYRETYIAIKHIESITMSCRSPSEIKVHVASGKEFKANLDCLNDLWENIKFK